MLLSDQDLNRLSAKAEETDNAANPQAAAGEDLPAGEQSLQTIELTLDAEMAMFMNMVINMLKPAFPSLETIYTPPVIESLSVATATVCKKHGLLQNGLAGRYAEELGLVFVSVPIGMMTYNGIKADIAANKARQPTPAQPEKTVEATA